MTNKDIENLELDKIKKSSLDQAVEMGLTSDEFNLICKNLNRVPNITEIGIFSAMFSEHCSYKSTKRWLKTLPTTGNQVIQGPGENAGVVDIGDNEAIVFKIESHNHPSFIEPYQGAATGVGGILRDIFTMGARPIGLMNVLRFGDGKNALTKHLLNGVVSGIGGYGNCIGIPTIGGETYFHKSYNKNILVNAMAIGLANKDKIFYSAASGVGNPVIYVGAKTGRDGIHGATMASAEFSDNTENKKPTVQVGDPFKGKLLLEACLELMQTDLILAIQDMGAAGLTSSSVEMASKGNLGIYLDLDKVPLREKQMSSYEIMLSESQERMLMILKQGTEKEAAKIFEKWDLDFSNIGKITDSKKIVLKKNKQIVCDLPLKLLVENAPEYNRDYKIIKNLKKIPSKTIAVKKSIKEVLFHLIGNINFASKKWIYEQYDSSVMGDTILTSDNSDASVIKIHKSEKNNYSGKGIAVTTDCTSRYVFNNPELGGMLAVVEAARNLACSGARALAVTNNLNFGNPEKVEVMGQIVGTIKGIKKGCKYFNTPVVSGNVSLYNETNGKSIIPTPIIGMVGIVDDINKVIQKHAKEKNTLLILGQNNKQVDGWMSSSFYQEIFKTKVDGKVPHVNLKKEKKLIDSLLELNVKGQIQGAHDISEGGLLPCIIEMLLKNNLGININLPNGLKSLKQSNIYKLHGWCFGEDQARILIATNYPKEVCHFATKNKIKTFNLGIVNNDGLVTLGKYDRFSIKECYSIYANALPKMLSS